MAEWLKLIPADDARRILFDIPTLGTEIVSLREAAGRVLATSLVAPHDVPSERRSGMDGYAVRAEDVAQASDGEPVVLRVVGSVPAGSTFGGRIAAGEAVSIATGGVVPDGADAVVMVEFTSAVDGAGSYVDAGARVRISKGTATGTHIVPRGEDLRVGVEVLQAGRRLRLGDLAALATFGVVDVPVFRRDST